MNVSLYNQYLVAQNVVSRIHKMKQEPGTIFFMRPVYTVAARVHVDVDWKPRNLTDEEKLAWAVLYIERFGGEIRCRKSYAEGIGYVDIQTTGAHGLSVTINLGMFERRPVTSEQDGDEAEALNT